MVWCFEEVPVEASVWSCAVVPEGELFEGAEGVSVVFVGVEPFLDFAVALGVFDATEDVLDVVGFEPCLEAAVAAYVAEELGAVVADDLLDLSILDGEFHSFDACFCGGAFAFENNEDFPACVVDNCEYQDSVVWPLMPVDMHCGKAMAAFVADPVLLPNVLALFCLSKTELQHDSVNPIMTYVLAIITVYKPL